MFIETRNFALKFIVLGAIIVAASSSNSQTLLGSTVSVEVDYPDFGAAKNFPPTRTVGLGLEFPAGSLQPIPGLVIGPVNIDIGTSDITLTWSGSGQSSNTSFDGLQFIFAPESPKIVGIAINPLSSFSSSQLQIGYTEHTAWVNFAGGLQVDPSKVVQLDLQLAPVPEPKTLYLLAASIAALAITQVVKEKELNRGSGRR
jgi:hypothetical protein